MFDLITSTDPRPLRKRSPGSKVLAVLVHATVLALVLVIPILTATNMLPDVPPMMAFVAPPTEPPPPPPPPPPPAAATRAVQQPAPKPASAGAAPIEAPDEIRAEAAPARAGATQAVGGVEGGVEGGVPGGVIGGIVGGILSPEPPPPPPPPPAPRGPVRIGGQLKTPALERRVEPVYPDTAAIAQVTGIVILEAVVDADGCVSSVKVLRSRHPLLDRAAVEAVRQWRYTPLVLDGVATRFVLTVTINFSVAR